jgi:hypothetical protein
MLLASHPGVFDSAAAANSPVCIVVYITHLYKACPAFGLRNARHPNAMVGGVSM